MHETKGQGILLTLKRAISGRQRLHNTHPYRGRFQACKCKGLSYLQKDPYDSIWPLRLMEDSSMIELSRSMVNFLRL